MKKSYKICAKTVMDTSDPDIEFDDKGISNHWHNYFERQQRIHADETYRDSQLSMLIKEISSNGKKKKYDTIVGVSGGVDSTYVCYIAKELGLNPLAVHFDNGWNSEIAVSNIENTLSELDIDLYTYVVDWNEFKDLQLSFLKASTPDGEVPTDHGMIALLYKIANQHGIKHILTGVNFKTESVLPLKWGYGYFDLKYIKSIHKKFGSLKLKTYPTLSLLKLFYYSKIRGIKFISFLDYVDYDKKVAMKIISDKLNWTDYGGKHYESVYTRFYQSYILPAKHNIDKRRAHLSNLICSSQITRESALKELEKEIYPQEKIQSEKKFVANKFGLSSDEFNELLARKNKIFKDYSNSYELFEFLKKVKRIMKKYLNISILEIE